MGTAIEAEITAYEPSAVSWPAEDGQWYTLVSFQFALFYCLGGNWRQLGWVGSTLSNSSVKLFVRNAINIHHSS